MISKMREYSKIFIVIVALAFIGLMVFEWGMDYTGLSSRKTIVGSVNGKDLSIQEWQQLYQQIYAAERQRSQSEVTEDRLNEIKSQTWEQFVQRILFSKEMNRLDIAVSDSEIVYQIRNYPLEELKNNPAFQTDGVFDWNKYYTSFSNPNIPWYDIEMMYRQNLPFQKLQNLISSTVRVSESEIEDAYFKENVKAKVAYLGIMLARFTSQVLTLEEEEIKDYYQDHLSDFQREEMRNLSYVQFNILPSAEDTARLLTQFEDIKKRYADGEDFNKMADLESDDPAVQSNHGQYDFFERGSMVEEFEKAAFNGKIGELVGPVKTQFGYHLILIQDKRVHEGIEQVKVSHILKEIRPGVKTRETIENNAYAFNDLAKKIGFQAAVDSLNLSALTLNNLTENMQSIPGYGKNTQILSFAFRAAKKNVVSDIIFANNGYTIFTVTGIIEAGATPLEEVRPLIESRIRLEKAQALAKSYAERITTQVNQGIPFSTIAESDSATPKILRSGETDYISLTSNVPGIGIEIKFNATALSLKEPQEISPLIETRGGLYWLKLIDSMPFDSTAFNYQKDTIRRRLLAQKKNMIFASWYNYLKDKASIEDNRRYFDLN
jgi:peptidyl-prolyl cis-trans isomerase D